MWAAPVVFSGSGASATTASNNFRAAIGGVKNSVAAPQIGGRREINWDGVKLDGTDVRPSTTVVDANKTVIMVSIASRVKARGSPTHTPSAATDSAA